MNRERESRMSEHTESGVRLTNFIFYGLIVLPIFNIVIFFEPKNALDVNNTVNFFVFFVTVVLASITIFNTLRFYNFYRTHENSNAIFSNFDIVMCYILPFLDIFRIPKMFTEVSNDGKVDQLTAEAKHIKMIIILTYVFAILFYVALFLKLEILKLVVVTISSLFGFYSGFYYALQIRKIYLQQNNKALAVEVIKNN